MIIDSAISNQNLKEFEICITLVSDIEKGRK